jgi:hypothetical protein
LKLDSNYFVEEIPSDIGRLSNLSVLNLDNNADLTGTVPSSLAKLTKLRLLSLSSTEVTGPGVIDQLLSWPLLEELILHNSFLSGTLPVDMSPLTNLLVLSLKDTLVGGAIPSSITKLTTLQLFDIGGPNLKGKIPNDIGKLTELCTCPRLFCAYVYVAHFLFLLSMNDMSLTKYSMHCSLLHLLNNR